MRRSKGVDRCVYHKLGYGLLVFERERSAGTYTFYLGGSSTAVLYDSRPSDVRQTKHASRHKCMLAATCSVVKRKICASRAAKYIRSQLTFPPLEQASIRALKE